MMWESKPTPHKLLTARFVQFTYLYKVKRSVSLIEYNNAYRNWRQFRLQEMKDLNDVFDRNDISSILRDVSADVKKCHSVLEARAAASRLKRRASIDSSKERASHAANVVIEAEHAALKESVRQLVDAVAENTRTLQGMQVRRQAVSVIPVRLSRAFLCRVFWRPWTPLQQRLDKHPSLL
jgi:hypothetical protein